MKIHCSLRNASLAALLLAGSAQVFAEAAVQQTGHNGDAAVTQPGAAEAAGVQETVAAQPEVQAAAPQQPVEASTQQPEAGGAQEPVGASAQPEAGGTQEPLDASAQPEPGGVQEPVEASAQPEEESAGDALTPAGEQAESRPPSFPVESLHGRWTVKEQHPESGEVVTLFSVNGDSTFAGTMTVAGEVVWTYSGNWYLDGNHITWVYNESTPPLMQVNEAEVDEILTIDEEKLTYHSGTRDVVETLYRVPAEAAAN